MKKHQRNFRNITGLTTEEFEKVVERVRYGQKKLEKQKKSHGKTTNSGR